MNTYKLVNEHNNSVTIFQARRLVLSNERYIYYYDEDDKRQAIDIKDAELFLLHDSGFVAINKKEGRWVDG